MADLMAASRIRDLEAALSLALEMLIPFEPGDSRAVSDEFVAMAAILCSLDDLEPSREIIEAASKRLAAQAEAKYA